MKLNLFIGLIILWSHVVNASILSFGYVPLSFPRDPVEFDQFDEHVVLGQIVEPLVDSDGDGRIVPGVAKEWHFSTNGKEIVFKIDPETKFSNGESVKSSDVVFSIARHLSSSSQSKNFLADIADIKSEKNGIVIVLLKNKNPAILKALTRDQLGIIPAGWSFDPKSNSPYIGTGPYNLKKHDNQWVLEANSYYQKAPVAIKKWRLLFYNDTNLNVSGEIPSVMPDTTGLTLDQIKKNPNFQANEYLIEPILGFTQSSFWFHPKGAFYKTPELRILGQKLLNEIVQNFCQQEGLVRSTGLIPKGIQGSLEAAMPIEQPQKSKTRIKMKVATRRGAFARLFSQENLKRIHEKYNLDIEVKFFEYGDMKAIQDFEPDVVTGNWAGGFNDPTGFLALLGPLLGQDFKKYLGSNLSELLSKAESEQEFEKRVIAFKNLGQEILKSAYLTPGWRVSTFEFKSRKIKNRKFQIRYTPRLINYVEVE